jgi:hypothetical protein
MCYGEVKELFQASVKRNADTGTEYVFENKLIIKKLTLKFRPCWGTGPPIWD